RAGCGNPACPDPWRGLCANMIPTPTYHVRVVGAPSSSGFFSLVLVDEGDPDSYDRGSVRAHPREQTRSGGTGPAMHRTPEMAQVSDGRGGVVRPPWIPRSRHHAAHAGAWTRLAVTSAADARSLRPSVLTKSEDSRSPGGWAQQ